MMRILLFTTFIRFPAIFQAEKKVIQQLFDWYFFTKLANDNGDWARWSKALWLAVASHMTI